VQSGHAVGVGGVDVQRRQRQQGGHQGLRPGLRGEVQGGEALVAARVAGVQQPRHHLHVPARRRQLRRRRTVRVLRDSKVPGCQAVLSEH